MKSDSTIIEPLIEAAGGYGKSTLELIKLKTVEKTSVAAASAISRGLAIVVLSIFIITANIGVALWLGDLLGKAYYGFFCIAALYLLIGLVLWFFWHKTISRRITDAIISNLLS